MIEYYGVIVPERKYHISMQCPAIRKDKAWKKGQVCSYPQQADAIISGHTARCPVCHAMYRFDIRVGSIYHQFLLNKKELDMLLDMASLKEKRENITAKIIGEHMGLDPSVAHDTMKRLWKRKLILTARGPDRHYVKYLRSFSPWGIGIVLAYRNNLYVAPIAIRTPATITPNTRIK